MKVQQSSVMWLMQNHFASITSSLLYFVWLKIFTSAFQNEWCNSSFQSDSLHFCFLLQSFYFLFQDQFDFLFHFSLGSFMNPLARMCWNKDLSVQIQWDMLFNFRVTALVSLHCLSLCYKFVFSRFGPCQTSCLFFPAYFYFVSASWVPGSVLTSRDAMMKRLITSPFKLRIKNVP